MSGSQNVSPSITTTYTLNANNSFGTTSATVTGERQRRQRRLAVPTITEPSAGQVVSVRRRQLRLVAGRQRDRLRPARVEREQRRDRVPGIAQRRVGDVDAHHAAAGLASCSACAPAPTASPTRSAGASRRASSRSARCADGGAVGDRAGGGRGAHAAARHPAAGPPSPAAARCPLFYEVELTNEPSGVPELQILLPDPTLSTVARVHSGSLRAARARLPDRLRSVERARSPSAPTSRRRRAPRRRSPAPS